MTMPKKKISPEESQRTEMVLLEGVVSRAGTLFFTWSFISTLYGFLSYDLFRQKIPSLTLWENIWTRVVFSSLPLLCTALWYKKSQSRTKLKAHLTIILLPLFLVTASLILAWPLFWSGQYEFYLHFHATNIIAMSSGIFVISASPRLVLLQCLSFTTIYFGPLLYLFGHQKPELAQIIISDSLLVSLILIITLKSIHQLRLSLALDENQRRQKASLFLGKPLADAIYKSGSMVIEDFTRDGLILAIDLRGYTRFMQSIDKTVVRAFMAEYYSMVNRVLSSRKSFLHKTSGDGLLISFGIMENAEDLSDIQSIDLDNDELAKRKQVECLRNAFGAFTEIANGLDQLLKKFSIETAMVLGAGCAYGSIEVIVRGDETYRKELDIHGSTIIRAVRLETYSKLFNSVIDTESSFLVLSPELMASASTDLSLKLWTISQTNNQVRDFPEIKSVLYRQWKHNRVSSISHVA